MTNYTAAGIDNPLVIGKIPKHFERTGPRTVGVGLGQDYFHTTLGHISMHELGETPNAFKGGEARLAMARGADALQSLLTIPPMVRKLVTDQTGKYCRSKGDDTVTQARFSPELALSRLP